MRNLLLLTILIFLPFLSIAQVNLDEKELEISKLFEKLKHESVDSAKLALCGQISESMSKLLQEDNSFTSSFSKLKHVGKIASPDSKLRIYTWNCVLGNGSYKYYGFIQQKLKSGFQTERLFDVQKEGDLFSIYTSDTWLGSLYYEIIPFKVKGKTSYVLLGWDGNNVSSNKKVIEILSFNKSGNPVFGKPLIWWRRKMINRVIFEYAKQARMSIKYLEKEKRLVFDHLAPSLPNYQNQFEYYGPDFSYDALQYKKGKWELIENIDIRNKKKK